MPRKSRNQRPRSKTMRALTNAKVRRNNNTYKKIYNTLTRNQQRFANSQYGRMPKGYIRISAETPDKINEFVDNLSESSSNNEANLPNNLENINNLSVFSASNTDADKALIKLLREYTGPYQDYENVDGNEVIYPTSDIKKLIKMAFAGNNAEQISAELGYELEETKRMIYDNYESKIMYYL